MPLVTSGGLWGHLGPRVAFGKLWWPLDGLLGATGGLCCPLVASEGFWSLWGPLGAFGGFLVASGGFCGLWGPLGACGASWGLWGRLVASGLCYLELYGACLGLPT